MIDRAVVQQAVGGDRNLPERVFDLFDQFEALVLKWNPTINIVAKSTLSDIGNRHIIDSVQLIQCGDSAQRRWLDIGSGGGFPGLVVAILAASQLPQLKVTLVESDKRKSVFLREAARQLELQVEVIAARVEDIPPQCADVVSARALASLDCLLGLASTHLAPNGVCAFLKGANVDPELAEARNHWVFDLERSESITDGRSSVLFLKGLKHV